MDVFGTIQAYHQNPEEVMELLLKMSFLAKEIFPSESEKNSCELLRKQMSLHVQNDFSTQSAAIKFINNIWKDSNETNFQKTTKQRVVNFFVQKNIAEKCNLSTNPQEIEDLLFLYDYNHLVSLVSDRIEYDPVYNITRQYNSYAKYKTNSLGKMFEYENSFFYLYRLHSFERRTMREVLIFGEKNGNTLTCRYYRYVPKITYEGSNKKDSSREYSRHVFSHKGNALISSRDRILCIFPPTRSNMPKEQDSGFVVFSIILDGTVKGGIFTKLSDAGQEPAAGRFALEEIKDTKEIREYESSNKIQSKVRSFGKESDIHKKYKKALNTKSHTTGEYDNLLLFNPQYHKEMLVNAIEEENDIKSKGLDETLIETKDISWKF